MKTDPRFVHRFGERLSASGINLQLSEAVSHHIVVKAGRLLHHQPRIDDVNIVLIRDREGAPQIQFTAKGRVERSGATLLASASGETACGAINLVVERLDRALRRQAAICEAQHRLHLLSPWSGRSLLTPS